MEYGFHIALTGADPEIFKKGGEGERSMSATMVLGFRWSKKAKVTFETISFWQNI